LAPNNQLRFLAQHPLEVVFQRAAPAMELVHLELVVSGTDHNLGPIEKYRKAHRSNPDGPTASSWVGSGGANSSSVGSVEFSV